MSEESTQTSEGAEGESTTIVERPEHIPQKFWDNDGGSARVDDMAKAYTALERMMGSKVSDLSDENRALLAQHLPDSLKSDWEAKLREQLAGDEEFTKEAIDKWRDENLPKAPDEYDFASAMPDGLSADDLDTDHPQLQALVEFSKESGLSQDQFGKLLGMGIELMGQEPSLEDRVAELGDGFKDRASKVVTAARNALAEATPNGPEKTKALADFDALTMDIKDPQAYLAFERLVTMATGSKAMPGAGDPPTPKITEAQIKSKMNDPRYWRDRDPALHAEVASDWQKLVGTNTI